MGLGFNWPCGKGELTDERRSHWFNEPKAQVIVIRVFSDV